MRKGFLASALMTAVTIGSAVFGGVALADEHAGSGVGGSATNNCLNVGVPAVLAGVGVAGEGAASGASCAATANGTGGGAY